MCGPQRDHVVPPGCDPFVHVVSHRRDLERSGRRRSTCAAQLQKRGSEHGVDQRGIDRQNGACGGLDSGEPADVRARHFEHGLHHWFVGNRFVVLLPLRESEFVATRRPCDLVGIMRIQMMLSTRCALLFSVILPAFGTTSILTIDATQMQAKITVQTDQTGLCTYRASRGTAFSTNVPDLTDNTNTDARSGSIVNRDTHIFILGTRKSNDALAAAATYWIGVTCGADSEVSRVFTTRPIQWGNTAPDILPFNPAKFGNMDHPAIDWNGTAAAGTFCDPATHSYCDPNTGVEYWPVSKPGWLTPTIYPAQVAGNWAGIPIDISGTGKWTNPGQVWFHAASPPAYATATGGPTDKLFIPLSSLGCPSGGSLSGFAGGCTIDDISFDVWCGNATTGGVTGFNLQLTIDGGQTLVGNVITTGNCPSSAPALLATYPAGDTGGPVARAIFKGWGYVPQRNMIIPPAGTVTTSGTSVTLTTTNYFNLDWKPDTPILINGSYAHLAGPPASSTTLSTVENLGALTNVAYSGANFGVVLTKTNSTASNVNVSIGLNYSFSSQPYQGSNGDQEMVNQASVLVSRSADGATCGIYTVGCSAGVLSPAVKGYLEIIQSIGGNGAVVVWIPRNSDGSPRGETRLLSIFVKPAGSTRVNGNGDTIAGGVTLFVPFFFDDTDGTSVYSADQSGKRAWRLSYTESYGGSCTGYQAYQPWAPTGNYQNGLSGPPAKDDCFKWTVITPLAGGKDIKTQIMGTAGNNGAYQSGLNYLGQTVGPVHTGYDLGWMTGGASATMFAGGFLIAAAGTTIQNHLGVMAALADDGSGNGTFVIKSIRNSWSDNGKRWAGNHTCPWFSMGTFVFCVIDPLDNFTFPVFPNRNVSLVSQVNRAGFGSTPNWDSNTSLTSNADFYTCPSGLPAPYTSLSGTTNCLQVRMHDPFCQLTPNTTYTFPDGKTEAAEFPCITPGFGVSNAAYSKLQDIQVGDYLEDNSGSREYFAVLTAPVYNGANDITFWLLRTAGYTYLNPTYRSNNTDDTFGAGHGAGQSCCTHGPTGWYLWAIPWAGTNAAVIDISSPSNTWLYDNPARGEAHAVAGPGSLPGTYNFSMAACGPGFNLFCGTSNLSPAASINIPFTNTATGAPVFAGIAQPTGGIQSYQNATYGQGASALPFFADFKAINPSSPSGSEGYNGYGSMSMSLVSGTTQTYLVAGDCCTPNPDYKRWGLSGYAGRFWLKDISGPATFGSAADMSNYSVCWARNNNECVFGSTPGKLYLSISQRDIQPACSSANFGNAIPCLSSFGPITGQVIQFRNDRLDAVGNSFRKFGFAHSHIGLGYSFSNCRTTPDAQFLFCPSYWMDGVRTDWLALRMDALPPVDNANRTNFMPIRLTYQGVPQASNIRARFGYAENGGDLLQCTAYGKDCSTEIPSASSNDPFSFTNEAVTRQACASGASCTVTIPSLPNRILYYVIDRLDANGNVLQTTARQAVAVP